MGREGVKARQGVDRKREKFMEQLYMDSIKPGAPAAIRDLYAVLQGWKVDRKEIALSLNADDIARRNIEAQRALEQEARNQVLEADNEELHGTGEDTSSTESS
jgi:hypothetical protein